MSGTVSRQFSTDCYVRNTHLPLDAQGRTRLPLDTPGVWTFTATARDAAGNVGTAESLTLTVNGAAESADLTVSLLLPLDGQIITEPTDVVGVVSATDAANLTYTVTVTAVNPPGIAGPPSIAGQPVEAAMVRTIVSGGGANVSGVLGQFDPTLLPNGPYRIELSASDGTDTISGLRVVHVNGRLKLGNFSVSFADLEIPAPGMPIRVSRTKKKHCHGRICVSDAARTSNATT